MVVTVVTADSSKYSSRSRHFTQDIILIIIWLDADLYYWQVVTKRIARL
jgi:hypothetical protein